MSISHVMLLIDSGGAQQPPTIFIVDTRYDRFLLFNHRQNTAR